MYNEDGKLLLPKMEGMFQTYEKVKAGFYTCVSCSQSGNQSNVCIHQDNVKIPLCNICKQPTYWYKI